MRRKKGRTTNKWYTMDLHLHTPASSDYQTPDIQYLDILKQAELKQIDIIAFTDHNTVAGYRRMQEEIEQLEFLEKSNRLTKKEKEYLQEYRRLLKKILVLPGFEFTATFGFHILGVFSPDTTTREIEHALLNLNIPAEQLDVGSVTVGASSDVLQAYREIQNAGGIAIAAHANSNNGVAMRGFPIGGQTKIAYTQDENLDALEVTDLESKGRRATAAFFSGIKPEYPRKMHCIQGSDAHRLLTEQSKKKNLGVGDRATEVLLPAPTFDALKDLFKSNDFARTRPRRRKAEPAFDFMQAALDEGANIVQDFHEGMTVRGGKMYAIIADICAFANTNGGTVYIGLHRNPQRQAPGVSSPDQGIAQLEKEISDRISPALHCSLDAHNFRDRKIIRVLIPRGDDPPYALDDSKIYLRTESDTSLAVRDEIVNLVLRGKTTAPAVSEEKPRDIPKPEVPEKHPRPRTGVEVVSVEVRSKTKYYTLRDLRNGNVVKNVTEKSARKLWHQAITRYNNLPKDVKKANFIWVQTMGLIQKHTRGNTVRYDLIQQVDNHYRFFFGVTDDGIHGDWKKIVGAEE